MQTSTLNVTFTKDKNPKLSVLSRGKNMAKTQIKIIPREMLTKSAANSMKRLPPDSNKRTALEMEKEAKITTTAATTTTTTTTEHSCKICGKLFATSQKCLAHELLVHTNDRAPPQKLLRNKINAMLELAQENRRDQLHKILLKAEPGKELDCICQFYEIDKEKLDIVYTRIHNCLYKELRGQFKIHPFGSIVSELALRDCDIDLFLQPSTNANINLPKGQLFNRVNSTLRRSVCFEDIVSISSARVPIIKCKHTTSGFNMDLNLHATSSIKNSMFLRDLNRWDRRLHKVMLFMKVWAKQLQIVGRSNMTSYCLTTLVLFYLQQKSLMLPIKTLQENCTPDFINGINYAYDLKPLKRWPATISSLDLIKGFFVFCYEFMENFCHVLLSPFLGMAIPLGDILENVDTFPEYWTQRVAVEAATGCEQYPIKIYSTICLQDCFDLSHNIAKSISQPNFLHFRNCINHAYGVCNRNNISSAADLYEELLFGKLEEMIKLSTINNNTNNKRRNVETNVKQQQQQPNAPQKTVLPQVLQKEQEKLEITKQDKSTEVQIIPSTGPKQHNLLSYRIEPSRAEIRALQNYFSMNNIGTKQNIFSSWAEYYVSAIKELITEIYCIDLQIPSPQHDKQKRFEKNERHFIWEISTAIDMWSGRNHQRSNGKNYMDSQREQTAIFQKQRRQNANFAVKVKGVLEVVVNESNKRINIYLKGHDRHGLDLQRNSPLTKLFAMLKCALQSFRLKEKLE